MFESAYSAVFILRPGNMQASSATAKSSKVETVEEVLAAKFAWEKVPCTNPPPPRQLGSTVLSPTQKEKTIFLYGGFGPSHKEYADFYALDLIKRRWRSVKPKSGSVPSKRHSHSAVVYSKRMYVFGGIGDGVPLNDLHEYDFDGNSWSQVKIDQPVTEQPTGRWGHSAVVCGDAMFVFGGFAKNAMDEFWRFDFATRKWKNLRSSESSSGPSARHYQSAVVHSNAMYLLGGYNGHMNLSDLWRFDVANGTWTEVAVKGDVPPPLRGHSAVVLKGFSADVMCVFGGRDKTQSTNHTYFFNFETSTWKRVESSETDPTPRHLHAVCVAKDEMFVFGGLGIPSAPTAGTATTKSENLNDFYSFANHHDFSQSLPSASPSPSSLSSHPFARLPPDLLRYVLLSFCGPRSTAVLSGVSRSLYSICSQEAVWKRFYEIEHGPELFKTVSAEYERVTKSKPNDAKKNSVGQYFWKAKYAESQLGRVLWWPPNHWTAEVHRDNFTSSFRSDPMLVRMVVVGGGGVGKSTLTIRYIQNAFVEDYDPTIEDSYRKDIRLDNVPITVEILDTAGPEEYSAMRDAWYRMGDAFCVTYSITSLVSFQEAQTYLQQVQRVKDLDHFFFPAILVGNKSDLSAQRQVPVAMAVEFAKKYNLLFVETSAKYDVNVRAAFEALTLITGAYRLLRSQPRASEKDKCLMM